MQRRNFIKNVLLGTGVCLFPNLLIANSEKSLPNVMLLGDSVSIGYTNFVQEMLKGKANVNRAKDAKGGFDNCWGTTKGLENLDLWLGDTKWDVIHFNFGLHDLKHVKVAGTGQNSSDPNDPQQADLKAYKKNLKEIVVQLKVTGAKLIFATTTPYPDKPGGPLRRADQPAKYNKVAKKIMKKNNIQINDLHGFALPNLSDLQPPKDVHFTKEGSKLLAQQVVKSIMTALK